MIDCIYIRIWNRLDCFLWIDLVFLFWGWGFHTIFCVLGETWTISFFLIFWEDSLGGEIVGSTDLLVRDSCWWFCWRWISRAWCDRRVLFLKGIIFSWGWPCERDWLRKERKNLSRWVSLQVQLKFYLALVRFIAFILCLDLLGYRETSPKERLLLFSRRISFIRTFHSYRSCPQKNYRWCRVISRSDMFIFPSTKNRILWSCGG